jgi:hypothetical protein
MTSSTGDSRNSNIIQAMQGVGSLFGPDGSYGQMPANGPPFFTADQIASVAAWMTKSFTALDLGNDA